jgi:hypothetical protein
MGARRGLWVCGVGAAVVLLDLASSLNSVPRSGSPPPPPPPPSPAAAAESTTLAPVSAALRCGGRNDVAADSSDVVKLFGFVRTVCVDQLGESQFGGGRYLPGTCNTPGCAHVVDLVESACIDSQGSWKDGFLGAAFGPILSPFSKLCKDSHAEEQFSTFEEDDAVFAITSKNVDTGGPCEHPDCLLMSEHPLPLYIIDGADELDGDVDCQTCGLSRDGESSCIASCMPPQQQDTFSETAASVGKSCSPTVHCPAKTFCDYNLEYLNHPQCQPCSNCGPKRWAHGNTTAIDQLTIRAPPAWTIQVTIEALYLPGHAQLTIETDQFDSQDSQFQPTILRGQQLPSEPQRVINAESGFLRLRFVSGREDAGEPATFILKVDMLCTKSGLHLGCGSHGDCGDDRKCQCHDGYTGYRCEHAV